jgi:geranylgeranyl reductase family protein
VGAGPGGAMAAHACARNGLRTALLERQRLPRPKVCGGGLSSKALRMLPFSPDPVLEQRILSGWVAWGSGRAIEVPVGRPGMMVCRDSFDAFLAEQAVLAGAGLVEGFDLRALHRNGAGWILAPARGEKIAARIVIAADGARSTVRRGVFPEAHPRTAAALEARVVPAAWARERLADRCLFDFGAVDGGYAWIFPKRDHFNVGVYRCRKTPASRNLHAVLASFLAENPFLRQAPVQRVAGALIPVSPGHGSLVRSGVMLVGDAAGLGDALFGEGIYSALRSGLAAAASAVACLSGGEPLTSYDDRVRPLRQQLRAAARIAGVVYRFPHLAFERMARSPYACRLLSGVITGEVSPSRCLWQGVATAPRWLLATRSRVEPLPIE